MFEFLNRAPNACASCLIACPEVVKLNARYKEREARKLSYKAVFTSKQPVADVQELLGNDPKNWQMPPIEVIGEAAWQNAVEPSLHMASLAISNIEFQQDALTAKLLIITTTCDPLQGCA